MVENGVREAVRQCRILGVNVEAAKNYQALLDYITAWQAEKDVKLSTSL
jgi:hypothetical protein